VDLFLFQTPRSWLRLSFPNGFKKIDNGRAFLKGISAMGAAKKVAVFRKKATCTLHLSLNEFLSAKRTTG
jgi:hypothetical protein